MGSARVESQSSRVVITDRDLSTNWQAAASPGGLIGVLGIVLSLVLTGGVLAQVSGRAALHIPTAFAWILLAAFVALILLLAVLVYGYVSISYAFLPEKLVIRWAWHKYVIDLASIQQILPAVDRLGDTSGRWRRFWTGYYVGSETGPAGSLTVVATLPVRRQLLIVTPDHQYAISPERPVLFVEEFERLRRAMEDASDGDEVDPDVFERAEPRAQSAAARQYREVGEQPIDSVGSNEPGAVAESGASVRARDGGKTGLNAATRPHVLNDPIALRLLGMAVLLNVAMIIFILIRYHSLSPSIALHWNVNGDPDRIGSPREIWVIPIITALVAIANLILAWSIETFDRFAARFLLAASCLVQLVAWVALITLMR